MSEPGFKRGEGESLLRLGVRAKLTLVIASVVGAVVAGTLQVTRQSVEAAYASQAETQARAQFEFFGKLQQARLQEVRRRTSALSGERGVRIRSSLLRLAEAAAANEKDDEGLELLYQNAADELQSLVSSEAPAVPSDEDGTPTVFYRLLNAKGEVLPPPSGINAGLKGTVEGGETLERKLRLLGATMQGAEEQGVGYLTWMGAPGRTSLQEVVVTRIGDPHDGQVLGSVVVGFPLIAAAGRATENSVAVWIEGATDSRQSPWTDPEVARFFKSKLADSPANGERRMEVGSKPYLFAFRRLAASAGFPPAYLLSAVSMTEAASRQRELGARIAAFGAMGLALGVAISLLVAHGLTVPVNRLAAATKDILEGRFDIRLPVKSRDEIGELTSSFNEMAEGLALKEKYHHVLNPVADKQVASELMSGRVTLGGETRDISVLFCDIRGFTALTERMPPQEVIAMLNEHMTALTRGVHAHHGVVDKFVGDLIMAIFGAPKSYGEDADLAARCALSMIEERGRLNTTSKYKIEMGIGVASGLAVAGCMGSADRLNYTVLGERVNLASRLCSKAGRMEVVIDSTTRDRLRGPSQIEPLEPLVLKGFADPVCAFKLLG